MEKNYKYKISIIMPIYNVEKYLKESIDSVINQTINFKKNVQLILVNDGSPDNSEEICLKYKEKYPNNIVYIKKENGGVSSARNEGMKYIKGKYVNFLDSDDKWSKNALRKAYITLEKYKEVILVSFRPKTFETYVGYTPLDYKFKNGNKIVDYRKSYENIQLSVSTSFMRSNFIKNNIFDEKVKYSEDAKFLYDYYFSNKFTKIALISSEYYFYRKRLDDSSAIQTKDLKDDWYFITTEKSYNYVLDKSKEIFNKIIPFAQYYVAYDYQFRLKSNIKSILNDEKFNKYLQITNQIFNKIDDDIFLEQLNSNNIVKNLSLLLKYDLKSLKRNKRIKNNLSNKVLDNFIKKTLNVKIDFINIKNNKLEIEGYFNIIEKKGLKFYYLIDENKIFEIETTSRKINAENMLNGEIFCPSFKISIDIKNIKNLAFICKFNDEYKLPIECGKFSPLSNEKNTYYKMEKYLIYIKNHNIIFNKSRKIFIRELKLLFTLFTNKNIKAFMLRGIYWITKPFLAKKNIWIISDRYNVAGDNGQAFFEYINKIKNKNIESYFVISKNSKDIKELKKIGKVLYYKTLKYRILFLNSKYIISSHCEKYTTNVTGKSINYFTDLYKFKYVFLQHGIINNDLSRWLNRYDKNIDLFITTSQKEFDSVLNCDYFYDKKRVKLTGLPRYDKLISKGNIENKILILPTWRSNLAGNIIPGTQIRKYNDQFKESEYFKFYNNLLNDKKLIEVLKKYNYRIKFAIHPSHVSQTKDFHKNSQVEIVENINYAHEFKTSKLLISDYSSVIFDFAYLRKPVIYAHFDYKEFFENQFYDRGYFDYEKDGFGEVVTDYDRIIEKLINYIKNDCNLENKYEKRINKFFKFNDRNNCKRVYEEILKLEN